MKKLLLLTSVLAWISGVSAEEKPKLIVGVVISHFYPEWMDMYGNELSENGLKRVMKQGARVNVNYNYFYTQTGVDHASIYTGNASILPNPIVIQRSVINRRIV